MKTFIIVCTSAAIFLIAAMGAAILFMLGRQEKEKNQSRTASARAARWSKDPEDPADPEKIARDLVAQNGQHDLTFKAPES